MASALQLAPRDVDCILSTGAYNAAGAVTLSRVQSANIPLGNPSEDIRELGSTNFWTVLNDPTVSATINRNLIGDLEVFQAINSEWVSGDSIGDLVFDSTGAIIKNNVYMVGGASSEIIWGAKDSYLTGATFSFDAGGLATEAWTFEGQEMTTDTVLANTTESVFTEMTAAAGYGGVRHDKISVQLLGTSLSDAIKERITSVSIAATVNRTALTELLAVADGGSSGPYARTVNLPFDVSASINFMPSENINLISSTLGSWNTAKTLAESSGVLKVTVRLGGYNTVYTIPKVTRADLAFNADVGSAATLSMTLKGLDVNVTRAAA